MVLYKYLYCISIKLINSRLYEVYMPKLELGCGLFKRKGFTTVDNCELFKPDILMDLNNIQGYRQFKSDFYDEIYMSHILEHLDKPFEVMKELHRILKRKGKLTIKVPHFSRGFTHSQHSRGFDVSFPLYFNRNFKPGYFGIDFKLRKMVLRWMIRFDLKKQIKNSNFLFLRFLNRIINTLANANPYFCSRIWCYWVGGLEEIEFQFIKP